MMTLVIDVERETDGRFIAAIEPAFGVNGVVAYGASEQEATNNVKILTAQVVADLLAHRDVDPESFNGFTFARGDLR